MIEGLSEERVAELEAVLLEAVPGTGVVGNVTLRTKLLEDSSWNENLYWEIRNRLIDRGMLLRGGGRGGSVRRALSVPDSSGAAPARQETSQGGQESYAERALYVPMAEVIRRQWAQDYGLDSLLVEVTAEQGGKLGRGKWTRPDITVASLKTYPYVPGKLFDVITFEVKPWNMLNVTVVYEALGHRRAATRAYALIHRPSEQRDDKETVLEEIKSEAKQHGIGIIIAECPNNYETWNEEVEAIRHDPDPERLNEFLAQQVSQLFREQLMKWFK